MNGLFNDGEFKKAPLTVDERELAAVGGTTVGAPANPSFEDAIFIYVDFEGWQCEYETIPQKLELLYQILADCTASTSSNGEIRNCTLFTFAFRHGLPHGFSRSASTSNLRRNTSRWDNKMSTIPPIITHEGRCIPGTSSTVRAKFCPRQDAITCNGC